ncbi:MAG: hypothetical protein Q8K81_04765 [Sulfuricurvum sp.]|nr:hypothetical protein [Sulfuricurvum sp.]
MKKILAFALALSATALLACPMKGGMMNGPMCQGMGQKCQCDTSKLPPRLEALGLSDAQKAEVKKIREESKAFHNQQHEKMMSVLTVDQRKKFDMSGPAACPTKESQMKMPMDGMGCKNCDKK